MAGGKNARDAVERLAEVIAVALFRFAAVERHADPKGAGLLPRGSGQLPLHLDRRVRGIESSLKGDAEGVTHGLEDVSLALQENRPHQLIMLRKSAAHRLRM